MKKNLIENFKIGNVVYLLRNQDLRMIIDRIDREKNEIICEWIDEKGKVIAQSFKPMEIGKVSELNRSNSWAV